MSQVAKERSVVLTADNSVRLTEQLWASFKEKKRTLTGRNWSRRREVAKRRKKAIEFEAFRSLRRGRTDQREAESPLSRYPQITPNKGREGGGCST